MKKTRPLTFPKDVMHERFWKKVDMRGGPDACWEWQSARLKTGYGLIRNVHPHKPTHLFAHRVAYFLTRGDPGDLYVRHTCDNPPCVNPTHLELGTHQQNMDDIKERGTRRGQGKLPPLERDLKQDRLTRQMVEAWANGASYKEIGEQFGVSGASAYRRVTASPDKPAERRNPRKVKRSGRGQRGERSSFAKLTNEIVLDMRAMYDAGAKQVEILRKYPEYSGPTVHRVVKRKTWKNLP